jgi:hypothetical protein
MFDVAIFDDKDNAFKMIFNVNIKTMIVEKFN